MLLTSLDNFNFKALYFPKFLKTFTQRTARLKNFLVEWLLVQGLKEGLVERATLYIKSEVILVAIAQTPKMYEGLPLAF